MIDFSSLGLAQRSIEKKNYDRNCYECREELRLVRDNSLVAAFVTSVRESAGEQLLSTHTDFIQRDELNMPQIRAVTEWLRELTVAAVWRLTSYTVCV